jgi:hypothetical protein
MPTVEATDCSCPVLPRCTASASCIERTAVLLFDWLRCVLAQQANCVLRHMHLHPRDSCSCTPDTLLALPFQCGTLAKPHSQHNCTQRQELGVVSSSMLPATHDIFIGAMADEPMPAFTCYNLHHQGKGWSSLVELQIWPYPTVQDVDTKYKLPNCGLTGAAEPFQRLSAGRLHTVNGACHWPCASA